MKILNKISERLDFFHFWASQVIQSVIYQIYIPYLLVLIIGCPRLYKAGWYEGWKIIHLKRNFCFQKGITQELQHEQDIERHREENLSKHPRSYMSPWQGPQQWRGSSILPLLFHVVCSCVVFLVPLIFRSLGRPCYVCYV